MKKKVIMCIIVLSCAYCGLNFKSGTGEAGESVMFTVVGLRPGGVLS